MIGDDSTYFRETESSFFLPHPQMTYFHKRCGTDIEPFPLRLLAGRTEASYWMKGDCSILLTLQQYVSLFAKQLEYL